jgi:D-alanyl-D-alanine carboxypeptidase
MTAALAGIFVNEGNLSWDKKILDLMPDLISDVSPGFELVTIGDLLSHRAGLPENLCWREISQRGSVLDQRRSSIRLALKNPPYSLGEFQYSNTGYVLIASILEHISGKSWEMLIQDRLLRPLGMRSAGFGGVGIHGIVDQPWSHLDNGQPSPINGPLMDNPPILAPAGGIHCSMTDWIKFLSDQLRGARCMTALLSRNIYSAMQAPVDDGTYGYGWLVVERSWASGIALTHSGSNTVNYAVCWLAPKMNFGFVVCCNQGGDTARKHCDLAGSIMIILYNQLINPPKASA